MPVILASGGIDSTVVFYMLAKHPFFFGERPDEEIINLVIDYGQVPYEGSLELVQWHQKALGKGTLKTASVRIPLTPELEEGPIFNPDCAINAGREPVQDDYINGRNTIIMAQAAALASAKNMRLYLGLHMETEETPTDRCDGFVQKFQELQDAGGFAAGTATYIMTPFIYFNMWKPRVVDLGYELGVPFEHTNSCAFRHPACGVCGVCVSREKLLAERETMYAKRNSRIPAEE